MATTDALNMTEGREGDYIRYGSVTVRFVPVDKTLAAELLERYNTHNRPTKSARVSQHVKDMTNDNWPITGDTIRFAEQPDGDGGVDIILVDGQHRLTAIEESGVEQVCIFVGGLSLDVQEVIDTNALRSLGDTLTLNGWFSGAKAAALIRRCAHFEAGLMPTGGANARMLTKTELLAWGQDPGRRPAIDRAIQVFNRHANTKAPGAASVIASAYYLCAGKDREAADMFFVEQYIEGLGVELGSPAKALHRRLSRNEGQLSSNEMFLLALKAWNHWRKNERIERILPPKSGWPKDLTEMPIF